MPSMYLIFGLHVYTATVSQVMAYTLPHFIVSMLIMDYIYGKVRTPFISEVYEILQSMYAFIAVSKVIANPRSPTFRVTPKGEDLDQAHISSLAGPFYLIYIISCVSLLFGVWRYFAYPTPNEQAVTLVTCGWEIFNLIILNTALGVLYEKRKTRAQIRMPADISVAVEFINGLKFQGRMVNLTMGGAMIEAVDLKTFIAREDECEVVVYNQAYRKESRFAAKVKYFGKAGIGIAFHSRDLANYKELVALNYGDSERWVSFLHSRQQKRAGIWRGFFLVVRLGVRNIRTDYPHFLRDSWVLFSAWGADFWNRNIAPRTSVLGCLLKNLVFGK